MSPSLQLRSVPQMKIEALLYQNKNVYVGVVKHWVIVVSWLSEKGGRMPLAMDWE